jgi:hypothetical protein
MALNLSCCGCTCMVFMWGGVVGVNACGSSATAGARDSRGGPALAPEAKGLSCEILYQIYEGQKIVYYLRYRCHSNIAVCLGKFEACGMYAEKFRRSRARGTSLSL